MRRAAPRGPRDHPLPTSQHGRPRRAEKLGTSSPPSRSAPGVTRFSFNFGNWGPRRGEEGSAGNGRGMRSAARPPEDQRADRPGSAARGALGRGSDRTRPRAARRLGWGRESPGPRAPAPSPGRPRRLPLPGLPRTWRRGGRGVLTAARGRPACRRTPRPSPPPCAKLGFRSPEPSRRRGRGSRSRRKVSLGAAEPPPQHWDPHHRPRAPRRTPPSHLPASAARPGLASRSHGPLLRSPRRRDRGAGRGSREQPEPGGGRRASARARTAGAGAAAGHPHPARPLPPPSHLLPALPPPLPPPPLSSLFGPFRPCCPRAGSLPLQFLPPLDSFSPDSPLSIAPSPLPLSFCRSLFSLFPFSVSLSFSPSRVLLPFPSRWVGVVCAPARLS